MNLCPPIVRAALTAVACVNACAQTLPGGDPAGLDRPVFVLRGIATSAPLQRSAQTLPPDTRMRRALRSTLATGRPRRPPAGDARHGDMPYASPYLPSPYAQSQDDPR
ncbi:hypothetical protein WJ47_28430 [Burkholderia ubonensis]|uniref:Lipoprotein n=1 Tax=Burkholderia ubonensis TaxID=101571 RepID=A0AB73G9C4_9BURK|nr:hypothetical protein [Burkholderia ubonensis]KVK81493.1 hypothetical protein WJ44_08480 [Burkholderia ubonensis]KVL78551.1 hypothetical protein WJ47_28430 [Burkholderia ubonensis]KVM34859.1 hypothetical protein WJ54_05605 [Burkholderia ubonensis]KVM38861.1 hypothetical protein WJ53_27440 [Burkholderia ubonensis]